MKIQVRASTLLKVGIKSMKYDRISTLCMLYLYLYKLQIPIYSYLYNWKLALFYHT